MLDFRFAMRFQFNSRRPLPRRAIASAILLAGILSACGGGSTADTLAVDPGSVATLSGDSSTAVLIPLAEPFPANSVGASAVEANGSQTSAAEGAISGVSGGETTNGNEITGTDESTGISTSTGAVTPTLEPTYTEPGSSPAAVTHALETGDASLVTVDALLDDAVQIGEQDLVNCEQTLNRVYPGGLIAATMPYLSNYVYSSRRQNYPLHTATDSGATYSWIGEHEGGSRYVYYGASIFQMTDSSYWGNLGHELKDNTLEVMAWITRSASLQSLKGSSLRVVALSLRAQHQLEAWLAAHGINTVWSITTDTSVLAAGDYDLLIGLVGGALPEVEQALANNKPVMVWSEVFDPGSGIHALGLNWNWWGERLIGTASSVEDQCNIAYPGKDILETLKSLKDDNLDFVYTDGNCPISVYTRQCRAGSVLRTDGTSMQDAYVSGAQELQQQLKQYDYNNINVFSQGADSRITQLAVLIGDKFRETIDFPLDKMTSSSREFYGAWFADHTAHYARSDNARLNDPGDFGAHLAAISEKSSLPANVNISPTTYNEWSSTGMTGRAGKPVTLTRLDNNPATLTVRFNMIRSGSTWLWNEDGYSRPKFVASHPVSLPAGKTVTLSSPLGGPIYVYWEAQPAGAADFELQIDGAVTHPLLDAFDSDSIANYSAALADGEFDWVDVKTPFAEVHSLAGRMVNAFNAQDGNPDNGYTAADVQQWVYEINTYLIGTNLGLAGFKGDGLPATKPNVAAFCAAHDLQCEDNALHHKPPSQHINADHRASCGDLCSGNPFDLNGYVKPLGYGESHEMGHNMQRHRLNFYGARSTETSNNIFPVYTAYRWMQDQGLTQNTRIRLPDPRKAYAQLQTSILNQAVANIGHPIWQDSQIYVNSDVRLSLYLQLAYIHDQWEYDSNTDANGWDVYTKLYKLERQYTEAIDDDATWLTQRARLGFSGYDRQSARAISGNDFMAISLSWISGFDHRDYLDAWGVQVSTAASDQISSNGFGNSVPLIFWRTPEDRYIRAEIPSRDQNNAMSLDGSSAW